MNKCEQIHETVIRDIVDIIMDIKNSDEVSILLNRGKSYKSVAQASSNLVLVFPVVSSKAVDIKNASMICKAIERKAVSMLQMLFSAVSITNADNAIDYIKQFHTNLKLDNDLNLDQFIDAVDTFVINSESAGLLEITDKVVYDTMMSGLKDLNYTLPDDISDCSINEYKIYPQIYGTSNIIREKQGDTSLDVAKAKLDAQKVNADIKKSRTDSIKYQILDSDIKKANELIPTSMIINFVSTADETPISQNVVIGVKAKLYPIDSVDMLNRIKLKNQDNNGFNKFIRASTREISFFKDFLFAIDKAKLDAISSSRRGSSSKIWKVLERRSIKSKVRRSLGSANDASAITTLVVTQEEAEYLKKNDNIDIERAEIMRPIMEAYNLMGVCIVDETMETAKFLFDTGDDLYETLSFNHLERESADNGYKKIINLMTKLSR